MINKILSKWLSTIFVLILTTPAVFSFFGLGGDIPSSENRLMNTKPVFDFNANNYKASLKQIINFPEAYANYFQDNFYLRNRVMKQASLLKFQYLGIYDNPEVLVGKDGWLEHYTYIVEDYITTEFTDDELEYWYDSILSRQEYYEDQDIKYFTVIVPIKSSVMDYNFPNIDRIVPNAATKLNDFNINNDSKLKLLYLDKIMSANPELHYYKSDFHWSYDGGYRGYEAIADLLISNGVNMVKVDKDKCIKTVIGRRPGDIFRLTGLGDDFEAFPSRIEESIDKNTNSYDCQSTYLNPEDKTQFNNQIHQEINIEKDQLDSVYILRDSFTDSLELFSYQVLVAMMVFTLRQPSKIILLK